MRAKALYPITLALLLGASGCTLSRMVRIAEKEQQVTVTPNPLVANVKEVSFEVKAQVPDKLVREKQRYKLELYYEYGPEQQREELGSFNFVLGEFVYVKGTPTYIRQFSFPYAPEKNPGRLLVQGLAIDLKSDAVKYTKPQQVATGLVTTPLLLVRDNSFNFQPNNYEAEAEEPARLLFYFEEDAAKLRSYLGSNLQVLDQYIMDNVPEQEVQITAWQSPDEESEQMAQKRAEALENYYKTKLNTLDYSNKKVSVETSVQSNSLGRLLAKVKASALPKPEQDEIESIVQSSAPQQEKVKALQQSKASEYLQRYVYPTLRAAQVQINYNRARKADYELYLLARKIANNEVDADVLSEQELQYAATLTPLLAEKRKLYEAAVKTTDKWPAYYNLGVVYNEMASKDYRPDVKKALLARAIHNLTFAGFRNPTAAVYYSLASAYHQRGDMLEALQYYDYAIKLGGSAELLQRVFADKAALEIEVGQYDDAIESLRYAGDSYQTNMNLGLSYLLKENYEGAVRFYTHALELKPDDALANYSLAIVGARTQNSQMLEERLRKAVNADSTFTQRAIKDLEFSAYRGKPAFQQALIR